MRAVSGIRAAASCKQEATEFVELKRCAQAITVQGLGFWGSGFRALGFRVLGLRLRVYLELRVEDVE